MRGFPARSSTDDGESKSANQLVKDAFSRRLYSELIARNLTQAELARRAGLNRDAVSTYITGKALPGPTKLAAIAKVFGMEPSELLPAAAEALSAPTTLPLDTFSFKEVAPGRVRLQVNRVVSLATAMEIGRLIDKDTAAGET